MRRVVLPLIFSLGPSAVHAGEVSSVYSKFDLGTCKVIEAGDEYIYEGTWVCAGHGGANIFIAGSDDRNYAAFGRDGTGHCAFNKTFFSFNTSLSPVEWRVRDGKPFAAIERWSVVSGENGNSVTWLVVSALRENDSCHVHYVSGSYPDANAVAQRAADRLAPGFDCGSDVPTFESNTGAPPIAFVACKNMPRE